MPEHRAMPLRGATLEHRRILEHRLEQLAHLGRVARDFDAAGLHHRQFLLRGSFAAGNNGARMSHPLAGRRRDACDETDHRLLHVLLDPSGAGLFVVAADLSDHDDGVGIRVRVEHLHDVDMFEAVDGIAADADAGRLAQPEFHELPHRFIGQRSRAGNHPDAPLLVDVARHDADLDLVGGDDAGAVGTDEQCFLPLHAFAGRDHVAHRNPLGDADDEIESGVDRFIDRARGEGRRHVDHRNGRAGALLGLFHAAENRDALEVLAGLVGIDAGDETGLAVRIIAAQTRVERAGLARDALSHHLRILADQNAHVAAVPCALTAATIFCAASAMLSAEMMGSPDALSSRLPTSSLVPFIRTTRGTPSFTSLAAAITPSAIVSHRMMPPNMLTRIPLTAGFFSISLNASVTFCVVAPPPTSRKFAGSAPNSLMVSIVAMASPAPFTKQPMLPLSEMYDKSNFDASISAGSSSSRSRIATMSGCRNKALESKLNFASSARTLPSPVKIRGLISANEASHSTKARYRPCMKARACASAASGTPILREIPSAWLSLNPSTGSMATLWIFSGACAATSSISMPPSELAIRVTRCVARSTTMPTYSSLRMSAPSSTRSRLTSRPSGPV